MQENREEESRDPVDSADTASRYQWEPDGCLSVAERSEYREIGSRTFQYAVRVIGLCRFLLKSGDPVAVTLAGQLLRSGGSVGANVAEAKSAESRADFLHKLGVALKEARESDYWIRLLVESGLIPVEKSGPILDETDQIIAVLTTIIVKTKSKGKS